MSDPKRWLEEDGDATPLERELLGSGRAMDPPESAMNSVWAALSTHLGPLDGGGGGGDGGGSGGGGPPGGMGGPSVTAPPGAAPPALGGAAATKVAGGLAWSSLGKGFVVALASAAVVAGGQAALRPEKPVARAVGPVAAWTAELAPPELAPLPALSAEVSPPAPVEVLPTAPPARPSFGLPRRPADVARPEAPPPAEPPAAPPPLLVPMDQAQASETPASRLVQENEKLAEARDALRRGDTAAALRKLDAMGGRFPDGVLAQEREALVIESLFRAGRREAASTRAESFLRAHPKSPHAPRVRTFVKGFSGR